MRKVYAREGCILYSLYIYIFCSVQLVQPLFLLHIPYYVDHFLTWNIIFKEDTGFLLNQRELKLLCPQRKLLCFVLSKNSELSLNSYLYLRV